MAKTADVLQAIWADPWFVALPSDGKLLFIWAITNEHSNLAGLYVVAEETIRHETKLSTPRLDKALEIVHPKMGYRRESGTVCVPSRPKHVRSKTEQIAKSIVQAIKDCQHPEIQSHYLARYGGSAWLGAYLSDLASEVGICEPQTALDNLSEVASHSHSHSLKEKHSGKNPKGPDPTKLPEGFDPRLAEAARCCLPVLQRTAEARSAQPVTLLAVARAVESYPRKDHAAVAGDVEHWTVHGNGAKRQAKDIVSRFRNFLDDSPDHVRPGKAGRRVDPALARIAGRKAA